jgi:hypothetical protein
MPAGAAAVLVAAGGDSPGLWAFCENAKPPTKPDAVSSAMKITRNGMNVFLDSMVKHFSKKDRLMKRLKALFQACP